MRARLRHRSVRHRLSNDPPEQRPIVLQFEPEDLRQRPPDICLADWSLVHEVRFEIWPLSRHEIHRVSAAKAAVHALTLLKRRIGHLDRAQSSQPVENERKLTTIEGRGVTALPLKLILLSGRVPGKWPRSSSTKIPLM